MKMMPYSPFREMRGLRRQFRWRRADIWRDEAVAAGDLRQVRQRARGAPIAPCYQHTRREAPAMQK